MSQYTGIIMNNADYHAHHAIGKSTLDLIARDPHLVEWSRTVKQDRSNTPAIDLGDALHAILLEPDRLASEFAIAPKMDMRTSDGKAAMKDFREDNTGKTILSADDYRQLVAMFDSVMAHPQARELIEADGVNERSFFWSDEGTGFDCKCRPDKFIPGRSLLVDVKSTPNIAKFSYAVEDYRYYVQDPWYCDGLKQFGSDVTMAFLVVQKNADIGRYPVQVFKLPDDLILYGRQTYRRNLNRYAEFIKRGGMEQIQELDIHYRFIDHCIEALEVQT